MDVKKAVKKAKSYVAELFAEEGPVELGLEEIEHDDKSDVWRVTVGFSRAWNPEGNAMALITGTRASGRLYKVVALKDNGELISVKVRETALH